MTKAPWKPPGRQLINKGNKPVEGGGVICNQGINKIFENFKSSHHRVINIDEAG